MASQVTGMGLQVDFQMNNNQSLKELKFRKIIIVIMWGRNDVLYIYNMMSLVMATDIQLHYSCPLIIHPSIHDFDFTPTN